MAARVVLLLFLVFFFLDLGWDFTLTLLNLRHARRNASTVPPAFVGIVDAQTYARSVSYTLVHGRFGLVSGAVSSAQSAATRT